MSKENKKKHSNKATSIFWLLGVCFITVGLLFFCQFYFGDSINSSTTFYANTKVNGIDVSGMTKEEANNILTSTFIKNKNNIDITLKHKDKSWNISGKNFEIIDNFEPSLNKIISYGRDGNIFQKKKVENDIKLNGLTANIPYQNLLGGLQNYIEDIIYEIEQPGSPASINFNPNSNPMFSLNKSDNAYIVDRNLFEQELNESINKTDKFTINIPTQEYIPENNLEQLIEKIGLRSTFSTNYSKSSINRKTNIRKALSSFNGLIIEPDETVSFNNQTGARTVENGYKNANIIFEGKYISGIAGGVCQASTTLYNALLLSDIEILQVTHHSLPASYVPLSFDAMVSEGYADLIFKNNLDTPIFIKTICTDETATVEIYGEQLKDNITIKTKSELVKIIPHQGDKIISDTNEEYSNKVLYKGEYYRLKYPQEGYETKGYIQYYQNGVLIEEKLVRHDIYNSQQGIIVEGIYDLEEGMSIPNTNVKYLSPQNITSKTIENAKKKWHIDC